MHTITRDPQTGGMVTEYVATYRKRSNLLAQQKGGKPSEYEGEAMRLVAKEQPDLYTAHENQMYALAHPGSRSRLLEPGDAQAVEKFEADSKAAWVAEQLASRPKMDAFSAHVEKVLERDHRGDRAEYAAALDTAQAERPDLLTAYTGNAEHFDASAANYSGWSTATKSLARSLAAVTGNDFDFDLLIQAVQWAKDKSHNSDAMPPALLIQAGLAQSPYESIPSGGGAIPGGVRLKDGLQQPLGGLPRKV